MRTRVLVATVALALIAVACQGRESIRENGQADGGIGDLASTQNGYAEPLTGEPLMLSDHVVIMSCAEVQDFAGVALRYLGAPPPSAGRPLCFVGGPDTGKLPDKSLPEHWEATVMYAPDHFSPETSDALDILDQGGIAVSQMFNVSRTPPPLPPGALVVPVGEERNIDINGRSAIVQRIRETRVYVKWLEDGPGGRAILVSVAGNYTPDEMVIFALSLRPGTPPNERPTP